MLIRSQDKKSLINMDNVTDLSVKTYVGDSEIMACYTTDQEYYQCIGKYSDKSKAIKVLDMIQDAYKSNSIDGDFPVFQMPSDEELEG